MHTKRIIAVALGAMFGGLFATTGWAQESAPGNTPAKPETKKAERIEITGSRIKRIDSETSAPVQVITREQIERSGATSVTELLKRAPASNAGSFDENAIASFTPGAGGVSLRGMGAQATLILINGRRVTPYGFASGGQTTFVDVNSIPLDAIERVEILLDSASAVYGSEAMAGVINVILRKDFTGYEANAGYGVSSEGDAARKHIGVTAGFGAPGKDNYNLLFSLEHQENDPLRADQRPNSSTADYSRLACPTGDRAIPIRATSMAPASSGRWRGARPSTTTRVRRSMAAVSMTRPSIRI